MRRDNLVLLALGDVELNNYVLCELQKKMRSDFQMNVKNQIGATFVDR